MEERYLGLLPKGHIVYTVGENIYSANPVGEVFVFQNTYAEICSGFNDDKSLMYTTVAINLKNPSEKACICEFGHSSLSIDKYKVATKEQKATFYKTLSSQGIILDNLVARKIKRGDCVRVKDLSGCVSEFIGIVSNLNNGEIEFQARYFIHNNKVSISNQYFCFDPELSIVLANNKEKELLLSGLKEFQYKYDEIDCKISKITWKPEDGEYYYYIDSIFSISRDRFSKLNPHHITRVKRMNCFKELDEAEKMVTKLRKLFVK